MLRAKGCNQGGWQRPAAWRERNTMLHDGRFINTQFLITAQTAGSMILQPIAWAGFRKVWLP